MIKLLAVGLGGFVGSAFRYLLAGWVQRLLEPSLYPHGTFAVNVLGCLLIGFLTGFLQDRHYLAPELRLFVLVGLLGGFTTFSTFSSETFAMLTEGQWLFSCANVVLSVVFGLFAVWLGYTLSNLT